MKNSIVMNIGLFLGLSISALNSLYSQSNTHEWASLGTIWNYKGCTFYGNTTFPVPFISQKDTLIEGKTCKVIYHDIIDYYRFYLYTSGDTVYQYVDSAFRVLYNFNLEPGDTLRSYVDECNDFLEVRIDSITSIQFGDQDLRVQWISPIWNNPCDSYFFGGPIIEKIGNLTFLVPLFGAVDPPISCGFIGYYDPSCEQFTDSLSKIQLTGTDSLNVCFFDPQDFVPIKNTLKSDNHITVFPNPAKDIISIQSINSSLRQIEIYDFHGRLIIHLTLPPTYNHLLNTGELKKGHYFLVINRFSRESYVKHVIIQ